MLQVKFELAHFNIGQSRLVWHPAVGERVDSARMRTRVHVLRVKLMAAALVLGLQSGIARVRFDPDHDVGRVVRAFDYRRIAHTVIILRAPRCGAFAVMPS